MSARLAGADEVRQHVHFAECFADDGLRCVGVCQGGPIGAGDVAAPHGIAPCRTNCVLRVRLGELIDRQPMAFVECLVQQLGCLVMMAGDAHGDTVQFVVRAIRRCDTKLLQDLPDISGGQAGADDGAVQIGIEVPDLGTVCRTGDGCRRFVSPHQDGGCVHKDERLRRQDWMCAGAHACVPACRRGGLQSGLGDELGV